MTSPLIGRLGEISASFRKLHGELGNWEDAWPADPEFTGSDDTGSITVTISPRGEVLHVAVALNWREHIEAREIVRALNQAMGAASREVATQWESNLQEQEGAATHASGMDRRAASTSLPEPPPIEVVESRLRRLRQAQQEAIVYRAALLSLPDRSRFESRSGTFSVVRSGEQLVSLEPTDPKLTFTTADLLAAELLDVIHECVARAALDRRELRDRFPALASLSQEDDRP